MKQTAKQFKYRKSGKVNNMKFIFLDINWVLNKSSANITEIVDESMVKMLKEIVDNTEAEVVLTSEYRSGFMECGLGDIRPLSQPCKYIDSVLKNNDITLYSKTSPSRDRLGKCAEIKRWLREITLDEHEPDIVESFVILNGEFNGNIELANDNILSKGQVIKIEPDEGGLNNKHVEQAIRILNKE